MVEIVTDEDWVTLTGIPQRQALRLTAPRTAAIRALAEGPITDPGGYAMAELARRMRDRYGWEGENQAGLTGLLRLPPMPLVVSREGALRRTFRIELAALPQRWAHLVETPAPSEPEIEPGEDEPAP